MTGGIEIY